MLAFLPALARPPGAHCAPTVTSNTHPAARAPCRFFDPYKNIRRPKIQAAFDPLLDLADQARQFPTHFLTNGFARLESHAISTNRSISQGHRRTNSGLLRWGISGQRSPTKTEQKKRDAPLSTRVKLTSPTIPTLEVADAARDFVILSVV